MFASIVFSFRRITEKEKKLLFGAFTDLLRQLGHEGIKSWRERKYRKWKYKDTSLTPRVTFALRQFSILKLQLKDVEAETKHLTILQILKDRIKYEICQKEGVQIDLQDFQLGL